MDMNEIKNNSPKRPVIFYYAIALIVLLALNFLLVPWMSERSVKETGRRGTGTECCNLL